MSIYIFPVEENIENEVRVGSQKALNIFRIMQEAIHNSLKHSEAENIIVGINSGASIVINIKDDGKGIGNNKADGNGLRNMEARAADAGLKFLVQSSVKSGTNILFETTTN